MGGHEYSSYSTLVFFVIFLCYFFVILNNYVNLLYFLPRIIGTILTITIIIGRFWKYRSVRIIVVGLVAMMDLLMVNHIYLTFCIYSVNVESCGHYL